MKKELYFAVVLVLITSVFVGSCSLFGGNDDGEIIPGVEQVYAGVYAQGIEDSFFSPCLDRDESWQLQNPDWSLFFEKFNAVGENPVFLKVRGIPTERGTYIGIFATFDRKFEVSEVLEVKSLKPGSC